MKIGIIGDGRFGAYLGEQFEKALQHHICVGDDKEEDYEAIADISDIIFFAVPIASLKKSLEQYKKYATKQTTILVDVCSVKIHPLKVFQEVLPDRLDYYVGTHPLFGPQSAPVSCAGQRVVICNETSQGSVSVKVRDLLVDSLGLVPIHSTAENHDFEMARTQVLNHFVGRVAKSMLLARTPMATATHDKFMDIVDIISGNDYGLFYDMNVYNPYAETMRKAFIQHAEEVDEQLRDGYIP